MKNRPVTVDQMTWPDVAKAIEKAPIAYIPVGPQECHGAGMTMGTDIFVPEAVALMASAITGGVVYKALSYCFTGATNGFRGTISIPMSTQTEVLMAIARNLYEQKFKAICFVTIHGPNVYPVSVAVRELFESENIVTGSFDPYLYNEDSYNEDSATKETAMCHAAMEYLDLEDSIPDVPVDTTTPERPAMTVTLPPDMTTGFHYNHINQHQPVRKINRQDGMDILKQAAETLAKNIDILSILTAEIAQGKGTKFKVRP